jgi:hypothetical protein
MPSFPDTASVSSGPTLQDSTARSGGYSRLGSRDRRLRAPFCIFAIRISPGRRTGHKQRTGAENIELFAAKDAWHSLCGRGAGSLSAPTTTMKRLINTVLLATMAAVTGTLPAEANSEHLRIVRPQRRSAGGRRCRQPFEQHRGIDSGRRDGPRWGDERDVHCHDVAGRHVHARDDLRVVRGRYPDSRVDRRAGRWPDVHVHTERQRERDGERALIGVEAHR